MCIALWVLLTACEPSNDVLLPDADAAEFVSTVDNPYFPLPVGGLWSYEASTGEGLETDEVEVTDQAKSVNGVAAVVVRDRVYLDGDLLEDTLDWYAQDTDGNVWYLGEETCEYEGGECVDTGGSWEWGVDGARPGIIMWADPSVDGQPYYQEYYPGEAEDYGEITAVGVSITVAAGAFEDCVEIHEGSTLETSLDETKVYCPGVGNVFVDEGAQDVELVDYDLP